ncbi:hypothetical protein SEUCBS139899_010692 [Sporothrix eucalyptigena]
MRLCVLSLLWASLATRVLAGPTPSTHSAVDDDAGHRLSEYAHAHLLIARASSSASGLLRNATTNDITKARAIVDDAIGRMAVLNAARQANPVRNHYRLRPGTRVGTALLAELEAAQQNTTEPPRKRAGAFWMEGLARACPGAMTRVTSDYGADPSGKADSTKAIQKAIDDGKRCGAGCSGSTTRNAIVYFPPGKYLVSSTINVYFSTQMIGDANDWPRLVASSSFVGRLGVLSTDLYVRNGGTGPDGLSLEWYINTERLYSQIRNFRIDISAVYKNALVCGLHYQVAQATSLENVEFIAKTGTKQQGMFSENGSGGVMSGITFTGGDVGFYGGNQQFSASRMTFKGCTTAAQIIWDWGWVWKSTIVDSVDVGFRLISDDGSASSGPRGLKVNPYFERARNQYTSLGSGDFVHLKDGGANGDGSSDNTKAVQDFFNKYGDGGKVIYVDAGTYLLSDIVSVPKDAKIVGETWAQFAATGSKFSDPKNPRVMLKVGNSGRHGRRRSHGVNVHGKSAGAAALWDVHARVGGAAGTGLTPDECPPITSGTNPSRCQAASMLLHVTKDASGYFDNMWLWVADHMIDHGALPTAPSSSGGLSQVSLYGTASEHSVFYQYNFKDARNIFTTMLQSESPYYQPTPQPPAPFEAAVGAIGGDPDYSHCKSGKGGDLDGCDSSWAVIMTGCSNLHVGSAGTYSWFSTYSQNCVDNQTCQKALWQVKDNYDGVRLQNIISTGAKNVMAADGKGVLASDNMGITSHPEWSHIALFRPSSKSKAPSSGGDNKPPSNDDTCFDKDNTFKKVDMPGGEIGTPGVAVENEKSSNLSIVIVNMTHIHMYTFDFGDVPPGRSRVNLAEYGSGNAVDCNGEAYYKVDGTDKTFVVRASTDMNGGHDRVAIFDMTGQGGGQRELIITGSVDYGFVTNALHLGTGQDAANWMNKIKPVIGDRQLRHVVMPGSHDGGMSTIDLTLTKVGDEANTQTQGLSHYDQLRVGSRYFDMRFVSVRGGGLLGSARQRRAQQNNAGSLGQQAERYHLRRQQVYGWEPGEVIVWHIKYMLHFTDGAPRDWDETKATDFFNTLETLRYRCTGLDTNTPLERRAVKTYMEANGNKGCVILLMDGAMRGNGIDQDRPASGIYNYHNYFNVNDDWSQKETPDETAVKERDNLLQNNRNRTDADPFYIMKWQPTPSALVSTFVGLDRYALFHSNPALYWFGVNFMDPQHFPTVILEDYIGLLDKYADDYMEADMAYLCTGLNLYLVSQNYDVSTHRNPLRKGNAKRSINGINGTHGIEERDVQGATATADHTYSFHGVAYANGTVDGRPSPGFHLGRVAVFKAGTRFDNGTVLTVDTPNPEYDAPY